MPAKKTQTQFIQDAINVHGDKYDYSKSIYKKSKSKVIIICHIHGSFEQTPFTHIINKNGCPSCGLQKCTESRTFKDLDKFINDSNLKHNNYYDYSKVELKGINSEVSIICPIHGEFSQNAYNHMIQGYGCQLCGYIKNSQNQPNKNTVGEFIENATLIHGTSYDYSLVEYITLKTPVLLICNTCNSEFWTVPNRHY